MEFKNSQQSRDRLSQLLEEIYFYGGDDVKQWTEKATEKYANKFLNYYRTGNLNFYSSTYFWLTDIQSGAIEYLDDRLSSIETYFRDHNVEEKYLEKFQKLRDYVLLEALRASDMDDVKTVARQEQESLNEMKSLKEEIKTDISNLKSNVEEDRKNANTQSITVLSIFTGIAMTFFAGFSLLGSAFSALSANHFWDIIIIVLVIGIILFNTIYALIAIACRISGVFPTQPSHEDCSKCARLISCDKKYENKVIRRWFNKFKNKYPFALAINMFLTALLVISALLFIA